MKRALIISSFAGLCVFLCGSGRAFAAGDLISVDRTVFIQAVVFLVSLYVLNTLFFKPMIALAEKRRQSTSGSSAQADELSEKVDKMIDDYNTSLTRAREEALAQKENARRSAISEAEKIVSSAKTEAAAVLEKRLQEINSGIETARAGMDSAIEGLAREITAAVRTGSDDR